MRVALYVRVSTIESAKEGYSIGEQEKRLRSYCEAKGWDVYHVYIDGGYSGANINRPAMQEMLHDLDQGRFDIVLVYKLDRLSRSQKDTMELIEDVFLPKNINFVSMTENLDTTTPVGMAMIGLLSVFAQLERAQIAERMAIGIEGRAREGKWHGGKNSPVGYKYENDELHIIEYEAMMLREAFEMFARRVPIYRICNEFTEKGYRHRYGYFLPQSLRNMLKNNLYVGIIEKNGEKYKGIHKPIVSQELFDQVQKIFEERATNKPSNRIAFKNNSYLAGLLRCKHCGAWYCKDMGMVKLDGTKSKFYSCYSRNKKTKKRIKDPNCKNKIWRMEELDNAIFAEITKLAFDPKYIEEITSIHEDDTEKPKQIDLITKRIEELSAQISRYSDLYSLNSLSIDEVKQKIDPLAIERESLKNELALLQKSSEANVEEIYEIAKSFAEVLESGDSDRIRFVVEELIEYIVLDNEHIEIHWTFA